MNRITPLSVTLSILSVLTLHGSAQACSTVDTLNTTQTPSTVILTLQADSAPADTSAFQLAGGASHLDTLNLGPRSDSSLMMTASVSQGTLSANCQLPMTGCMNMSLTISSQGQICPPPPPDDVDDETCKHDNGNHWGEYRKLGMVVPPHSGKPNATKPCKPKKSPGTPPPPGPTCSPQIICTFLPHE